MYVCILNQRGEMLVHRHRQTTPETFLNVMAPSRAGLVVAAEGLFPWYWLADLGTNAGLPFVLGHAVYMKASPGGKAKHDTIDSHKIAVLLRGGMLPQADVYPAQMRATRALLRRRMPLADNRAARLAHVQHPNRQDHRPAMGQKMAYKANRDGVAERCTEPAVQQSSEVDLRRIGPSDDRRRAVALTLVKAAKHHDATPL